MRRLLIALAAGAVLAACGGHTSSPAATAPRDPVTLRYGAGAGRYRVEQQVHIVQEAMGQTSEVQGTITMLVSSGMTADGANLAAVFTVDSLAATVNLPAARSQMEEARGKTFHATFTAHGNLVGRRDTSTISRNSGEALFREFLPVLPDTLTAGRQWSDTSDISERSGNVNVFSVQIHSVRQHRVVGWELYEGARALHLTTTASYTLSGTSQGQAGPMTASGSGLATAERFVSASGVYLGGSSLDSNNMTVTVVSMGMDVPVREVRRSTLTRLP